MMNRGDSRLLFVILATAMIAAVATSIVTELIRTSSNHDLLALERRVNALENAPPPVAIQPAVVTPMPIAQPEPATPSVEPLCDEVSCVLNNYEDACCATFNKAIATESLDRAMISEGIGQIKARVMVCGDRFTTKGRVKVSVKVAPNGAITSVVVKDTPDTALGTCVVEAVRHATFAKTTYGGSFGYPFVF